MEEENKVETLGETSTVPVVEPVTEAPAPMEVPTEAAPLEPVTEAPTTAPVAETTPAPEAPKKKGGGIILVLLILVLAIFAVWFFVLGGDEMLGLKKEAEEPKQEEKQEEKKEEPVSIVEVSEADAMELLDKYAIHINGHEGDYHCGVYVRLFKDGGSSLANYSDWDRQEVIMNNLRMDNNSKTEYTLDEYVSKGKELFGSSYEAKIANNEGTFVYKEFLNYSYNEESKILTLTPEELAGDACYPEAYQFKYVSGENNGKAITLNYKVLFQTGYTYEEYVNADLDTEGKDYTITFVKEGNNFIFSKAE